jgi:hypothetical protein
MKQINCGKPTALELLQIGPSLFVNIGFDPTCKPGKTPIAGVSNVEALIDTGAKISCIDEPLAIQLGLPARQCLPAGDGIKTEY